MVRKRVACGNGLVCRSSINNANRVCPYLILAHSRYVPQYRDAPDRISLPLRLCVSESPTISPPERPILRQRVSSSFLGIDRGCGCMNTDEPVCLRYIIPPGSCWKHPQKLFFPSPLTPRNFLIQCPKPLFSFLHSLHHLPRNPLRQVTSSTCLVPRLTPRLSSTSTHT